MHVLLINPNTNAATTAMMLGVARAQAPPDWRWTTLTALNGSALIDCKEALDVAAAEVAQMAGQISVLRPDAVIVAAFGDPGAAALREATDVRVFGIGEAAMRAADALGLPYSILTITPRLRESTLAQVQRYGCEAHFNSLVICGDNAAVTTQSQGALMAQIQASIEVAIHDHGSKVLVIGGGPVAAAAQALGHRIDAITIQPLIEAVNRVKEISPFSISPST